MATYHYASYSQVALDSGHSGQVGICGIALGCDHIFRIMRSIFGSCLHDDECSFLIEMESTSLKYECYAMF